DVDVVAIDPKLVHRDQRGRAAIDQRVDALSYEMEAGIESPARAEGIAAADELQIHGFSPRSCEISCQAGLRLDASIAAAGRHIRDAGHILGLLSATVIHPQAPVLSSFFYLCAVHSMRFILCGSFYNGQCCGESFEPAVCATITHKPAHAAMVTGHSEGDVWVFVRSSRSGALVTLAMAAALAGCAGTDFDTTGSWFAKPLDVFGRNAGYTYAQLDRSKQERPITANDLVDANGACPTPAVPAAAAPDSLLGGGIAIGMSECDVVARVGLPSAVNLGRNPNGDRSAVMTFKGGARPGVYRFVAGRLTEMDRVDEPPPPPPQPAKKKPVKTTPAKTTPAKTEKPPKTDNKT